MEIHAMLAYGSAASSLDLMWRYHAMDVVLPQVAAHLAVGWGGWGYGGGRVLGRRNRSLH